MRWGTGGWSRALVPVVVSAALCAAGCRVFDESLLEEDAGSVDAGPRDAGADAGGKDSGPTRMDAGPGCALTRPPRRPEIIDATSVDDVWFALEGIDLDQDGDEWKTIGYDLDGLCSDPPDPDVECLPPAASSVPETDGVGGIDNVMGHQVLPLLNVVRPEVAINAIRDQHHGVSVFVIRLRRWNGTPNDPYIDVTLAISEYGTPELPDGGVPMPEIPPDAGFVFGDGGTLPPPRWDGTDYWWLRADNFLGGDPERPRIHDGDAYMVDGVLVMRLPDSVPLLLTGGFSTVIFQLTDATLTAHLTTDFMAVDRAVISGRWAVTTMLEAIESAGVCPGTDDYDRFARLLDLSADIRATPGTGGPGATCDALSLGVVLHGTRAHFGGVSDILGVPNACARMMMDAGAPDAGLDAGMDAGLDSGLDAGLDAGG